MLATGDELPGLEPAAPDERNKTFENIDEGVVGVTMGGGTVGDGEEGNEKLTMDELGVRLGALVAAVELAELAKLDEVAFLGKPPDVVAVATATGDGWGAGD